MCQSLFIQSFYRTSPATASKYNATFKELFSLPHGTFKSKRASTWCSLKLSFCHGRVLMLKRVV